MNVRLEPKDLESIIKSFKECFGEHDHLWLFGSRVYLDKRGGDIDLYIEVEDFDSKKVYDQKSQFWILLQDRLGEQKIDIVVRDPGQDLLIYKVARSEGVTLV
ncbi:MAG: nucleotidyltransferase domain-containing protein [Alphaproteobacteria bacterium]|nr:nucleotidyltransferase domain-containing protein [Alphaproteobacteria bacterium]